MAKSRVGMNFYVMGKEWACYLWPNKRFNKAHGKTVIAVTVCDDKKIYFREGKLSLETVTHEIFHAYIWESGARSMELDSVQMEELCAEVFSKHGKAVIATAELILAMKESVSDSTTSR